MDKFTSLLFNNRKALNLPISEHVIESYRDFNNDIEVQTLVNIFDQIGYTWEINDGFIVGVGY